MFPPIAINPLDALRLVTGKTKHGPVIQLEVEAGGGHYLAEAVPGLPPASSFPFDPPGTLRAALDGYALPPGSGAGDELDTGADLASILEDGRDAPPEGSACRVEAGGLLPPKTWAILPVSNGTLLGTGKVRIDLLPQAAEGILGRHNGTPRDIEVGTLLSPRIQAHLLAAGISRARVYSPPRVGVLLLGEELMDEVIRRVLDHLDFLGDHFLLALDVVRPERRPHHDVRQHVDRQRQMLVEGLDVIARVFLRGKRVHLPADGVDRLGDVFSAARFGALEQHVLDEMGDAVQLERCVAGAARKPHADAHRPDMRHPLGKEAETVGKHVANDRCLSHGYVRDRVVARRRPSSGGTGW